MHGRPNVHQLLLFTIMVTTNCCALAELSVDCQTSTETNPSFADNCNLLLYNILNGTTDGFVTHILIHRHDRVLNPQRNTTAELPNECMMSKLSTTYKERMTIIYKTKYMRLEIMMSCYVPSPLVQIWRKNTLTLLQENK